LIAGRPRRQALADVISSVPGFFKQDNPAGATRRGLQPQYAGTGEQIGAHCAANMRL
jgi:hypothetical protein